MGILIDLLVMFLIAWVAIKSLKVVAWIVFLLIVANFLSATFGILATIGIIAFMVISRKPITDSFVVFLCLVCLFGLL